MSLDHLRLKQLPFPGRVMLLWLVAGYGGSLLASPVADFLTNGRAGYLAVFACVVALAQWPVLQYAGMERAGRWVGATTLGWVIGDWVVRSVDLGSIGPYGSLMLVVVGTTSFVGLAQAWVLTRGLATTLRFGAAWTIGVVAIDVTSSVIVRGADLENPYLRLLIYHSISAGLCGYLLADAASWTGTRAGRLAGYARRPLVVLAAASVVAALMAPPSLRERISWNMGSGSIAGLEQYLEWYPDGERATEARVALDSLSFDRARRAGTVRSFDRYLADFPDGRFAGEALGSRDSVEWARVLDSGSGSTVERYLAGGPPGRYAALAVAAADSLAWERARSVTSVASVQRYLDERPEGSYRDEALALIQRIRTNDRWFERARDVGTVRALQEFLDDYQGHARVEDARRLLAQATDSAAWIRARDRGTEGAVLTYLRGRPAGAHRPQALEVLEALRRDDAPYTRAVSEGTPQAYERFLRAYPGHTRAGEVRAFLNDLHVANLLDAGRIELEARGSNIRTVRVRVRRIGSEPVTVTIPVGTYFVANNRATQNMVTTASVSRTLRTDEWVTIEVEAACANKPRAVPGSGDSFRVEAAPPQSDMARLVAMLESASVSFDTRQAAVWIVSDDASFGSLGSLVTLGGRMRTIDAGEAVLAMRLVEQAGIDLRSRRIWRDRMSLADEMEDPGLAAWLRG